MVKSRNVFSVYLHVDDSFDDDDEEDDEEEDDDDEEEENEEQMDSDDDDDRDILVVDGIELTKRDVERMEERLARLQHEFDSGEINQGKNTKYNSDICLYDLSRRIKCMKWQSF